MKKTTAVFIIVFIFISLGACSNADNQQYDNASEFSGNSDASVSEDSQYPEYAFYDEAGNVIHDCDENDEKYLADLDEYYSVGYSDGYYDGINGYEENTTWSASEMHAKGGAMYYKNGEVAHKTSDQEATDFVRDVYAIGYYDGYYDGLYGYEEGTSYDIRAEY